MTMYECRGDEARRGEVFLFWFFFYPILFPPFFPPSPFLCYMEGRRKQDHPSRREAEAKRKRIYLNPYPYALSLPYALRPQPSFLFIKMPLSLSKYSSLPIKYCLRRLPPGEGEKGGWRGFTNVFQWIDLFRLEKGIWPWAFRFRFRTDWMWGKMREMHG